MIEVTIALTVLAIVGIGTSASLASTAPSNARNREAGLAQEAVQGILAELRALPRDEVYLRYNTVPADDPPTGISPGPDFDVPGLTPTASDPDGSAGSVQFPGGALGLREDVVLRELGMPRDLNGDGAIDALDHTLDHRILPVRVAVTYQGPRGQETAFAVTQL